MTVTNGEITGAGPVGGAKTLWRITVKPVDGRDVTVELPATTDCSATGAVCTGGDSPQPLSNSITHTFLGTQLSAEFEGFDFHHDGSTPTHFRLVFSEEVGHHGGGNQGPRPHRDRRKPSPPWSRRTRAAPGDGTSRSSPPAPGHST